MVPPLFDLLLKSFDKMQEVSLRCRIHFVAL